METSVLLLSQRELSNLVANCVTYEFEDVIASVTNADVVKSTNMAGIEMARRAYKLARSVSGSRAFARMVAPPVRGSVKLDKDYGLFLPIFNHTHELYGLASVPNWRARCEKAACFITEMWTDMLPGYLVELLSDFDHIFVGCQNVEAEVARMTGRPCTYLPLAVDVTRFAPETADNVRAIDISYIGRRSDVTHAALLDRMQSQPFFYYYDTVAASGENLKHRTFRVDRPSEHRRLLASLLKNSRYFVANRSYVNRPEFTAGRDEISPRFFEGTASGSVVLGEPPRTDAFKANFDWPDAVIHLPFDSPDVAKRLAELDSDRERLRLARHNNVRNAALRHDWLHRLNKIFSTLGLPQTGGMERRARQLERIAMSARIEAAV